MSNHLNRDNVRAAWGARPPEWILALSEECDKASQGGAAKRLNVSPAVVNQVLKKAYTGRWDRIEERVRGEFMKETVRCPILAEISKRECLDHQARGYDPTNSTRVKLYQACRRCPNRIDP